MRNFKGSGRPEKIQPALQAALLKPPMKKHFETMQQMIKDASKYTNAGEHEISDKILSALVEYINKNKSQEYDRWQPNTKRH